MMRNTEFLSVTYYQHKNQHTKCQSCNNMTQEECKSLTCHRSHNHRGLTYFFTSTRVPFFFRIVKVIYIFCLLTGCSWLFLLGKKKNNFKQYRKAREDNGCQKTKQRVCDTFLEMFVRYWWVKESKALLRIKEFSQWAAILNSRKKNNYFLMPL